MESDFETLKETTTKEEVNAVPSYAVILHNDEVNSFDYVAQTLIEVCDHDSIQAEQCTYLTHFNGRCDVKVGELNYLRPIKTGLIDKGLQATIEKSK